MAGKTRIVYKLNYNSNLVKVPVEVLHSSIGREAVTVGIRSGSQAVQVSESIKKAYPNQDEPVQNEPSPFVLSKSYEVACERRIRMSKLSVFRGRRKTICPPREFMPLSPPTPISKPVQLQKTSGTISDDEDAQTEKENEISLIDSDGNCCYEYISGDITESPKKLGPFDFALARLERVFEKKETTKMKNFDLSFSAGMNMTI